MENQHLSRLCDYTAFRASLRTSRKRRPTIKSSPACSVIEIIRKASGRGGLGVLGSPSCTPGTVLGLLPVSTSIRGDPSRSFFAHSCTFILNAASSHLTVSVG